MGDELNRVWDCLKSNLDQEMMGTDHSGRTEWISNKESEMANCRSRGGRGKYTDMLENDKGAELTKSRVYELIEYLK